jgi:hypothetical protein
VRKRCLGRLRKGDEEGKWKLGGVAGGEMSFVQVSIIITILNNIKYIYI